MGHFCTQIYLHLVFATKGRDPSIRPEVKEALEPYMKGIYGAGKHSLLTQFAMSDHYHGLFRLHPAESISSLVFRLKGGSAYMLNKEFFDGAFEWQIGYGAFGHLAGDLDGIIRYIEEQPHHHSFKTLDEEAAILNLKYGSDWKPL